MINKITTYFHEILDNPWILLDDIMLVVRFGIALCVFWSFISIFYSLFGGGVADIINPNDW